MQQDEYKPLDSFENQTAFEIPKAEIKEQEKSYIDPIAKYDLALFEQSHRQDPPMAYSIYRKMEDKPEYAQSVFFYYEEQAKSLNLPNTENVARSMVENIHEIIKDMPQAEKDKLEQSYRKNYPNGFKTTKQIETEENAKLSEIEKRAEGEFNLFSKELGEYLKTEQGNENEQLKRLSYFQTMVNRDPDNFDKFTERYFTDGDLRNALPEDVKTKLNRFGNAIEQGKKNKTGAIKFNTKLKEKIVSETKKLTENKALGAISINAKNQLKEYYASIFKKEYTKAKKKLIHERMSKQQKMNCQKLSIN